MIHQCRWNKESIQYVPEQAHGLVKIGHYIPIYGSPFAIPELISSLYMDSSRICLF
jgi:hypothetical protein